MANRCESSIQGERFEKSVRGHLRSKLILLSRFRRIVVVLPIFLAFCAAVCHAQSRDVVCREGAGEFTALHAAVRVHVGPVRVDGLATRACEAILTWIDQTVTVASGAWETDLDAFGVDLGLGAPVAAFQVKKSKGDCCMEYELYSLREPPALLRQISGGEFFAAADTDLDGRVEIWTDDAAAFEGFEKLRRSDFDFPPPVVLRFERGRLLDASADFDSYYDDKIAGLRARLSEQDLGDFKNSDGKLLDASAIPPKELLRLRGVKAKVLEIVWCYLYSGHEKSAWASLAEMWPAADAERVRAALTSARARGIRAQIDGVSGRPHPSHAAQVKIFDATVYVAPTPGVTPKNVKTQPEITQPRAILMERPPPETTVELELAHEESELEIVIDSAGKVRSVEQVGKFESVDEGLLRSTSAWKFIPAFSEGQPVASKIFLGVSLRK